MKTAKQRLSPSAAREPRPSQKSSQQTCPLPSVRWLTFASGRKQGADTAAGKPVSWGVGGYAHVARTLLFGGWVREERNRKRWINNKGRNRAARSWSWGWKEHSAFPPVALGRGPLNRTPRKTRKKTACLGPRQGAGHGSAAQASLHTACTEALLLALILEVLKAFSSPVAMRCWPHCWNWKIRKTF